MNAGPAGERVPTVNAKPLEEPARYRQLIKDALENHA